MTRPALFIFALCLPALAGQRAALAQNTIEDIIKKAKLTRPDQATLEAEVTNKVQQLVKAPNAQALADRRDGLIRLAKTSGITPAGLGALASAAANPLQVVAAGSDFDAAFAAARILSELDHPNTARALIGALASDFPAVRYTAARSLKALLPKVQGSPGDLSAVLDGLARQGARERDAVVLRSIYDAIDVHGAGVNIKSGDACAAALAAVFRGRHGALVEGSRDETRDARGYSAAPACYDKSGQEGRNQLIAAMAALLQYSVDRFFDPDTSVENRPRIARIAEDQEKIIRGMMKTSGATQPAKTVAAALKARSDDAAAHEAEARAALDAIFEVLHGEPWNLP